MLTDSNLLAEEKALAALCLRSTEHPGPWLKLGALRHRLGRLEASLAAFERAAVLAPKSPEPWNALGTLLQALKRPNAALVACNRALALAPDDPATLHNVACLLEELGHDDAALVSYHRAISGRPDFLPAQLNRCALLLRLQRIDDAIAAGQEAARLFPDSPDCRYNLGDALLVRGQFDEALEAFQQALRLDGSHTRSMMGKGIALAAVGRLDEAAETVSRARHADPHAYGAYRSPLLTDMFDGTDGIEVRRVFLKLGMMRLMRCDWSERDAFAWKLVDLINDHAGFDRPLDDQGIAFICHGLPVPQPSRLKLAQSIAAGVQMRAPAAEPIFRQPSARRRRDRLRIGYVSPDFRNHALAHLVRPLFDMRSRENQEVFAYALTPDDGSTEREAIRGACDAFRDVSRWGNADVVRLIAYDGIDVLIDLAGYTLFARPEIFAARPAAIQASYMGFAGTLGAPYMDYALVDASVCPSASAAYWSERLAYLPHTYYIYDNRQPLREVPPRSAVGLPQGAFVYCAFNNSWKLDPAVFDVWMRILRRVPASVLWLLSEGAQMERNLRGEARRRGIAEERLVFAQRIERDAHLARHRCADLFLDAMACNAHTGTADALWAGLPVLTCPGEAMPSRVAAGMLIAHGMPELVAADAANYEEEAVRLALRRSELAKVREKVWRHRRTHPLFDTQRRVREFERAYEMMWQRYTAGLPPESFVVPSSSEQVR